MKIVRMFGGLAALFSLVLVAVVYTRTPVQSFNVQDSPATANRPGADISDVYLFPSPTNSNNVVAVMNVHPLIAAGAGLSTFFDSGVLYQLKFDSRYANEATNARPVENVVLQVSTGPVTGGTQQILVYGPSAPPKAGTSSTLIAGGQPSGLGGINRTFQTSSGVTVFAGAREDPFFFDLQQFYKILPDRNAGSTAASCLPNNGGNNSCPQGFNPPGTASDFFANSNVLSIVVEFPKTLLVPIGTPNGSVVAYWATTSTTTGL